METLSKIPCRHCGIELKGRQKKFCSNRCKRAAYVAADPEKIKSYRRAKREEYKAWQQEIKLEKGCARCGYKEHACALDFNHLDPDNKKFNISSDVTTKERLLEEVNKCEILCANCHRVHTQLNDHYNITRMGTA